MIIIPTAKCLHPRIIENKYTKQKISVGCGVCEACLIQRSKVQEYRCSLEESFYKYSTFATLTYSNEFVPLMQPLYSSRRKGYVFYNMCTRFHPKRLEQQSFFEPDMFHKSKTWLNPILIKVNLNGCLPFANVIDIQLFLKKLRKYLKPYTDEKIRYYVVSEYGPKTFRPHYHISLYYNSDTTHKYIGQCIRKAWSIQEKVSQINSQRKNIYKMRSLGNIDFSTSRGKTASYVAKYLNSYCALPRFYQNLPLRPFRSHSKYFAQGIFKGSYEEIYKHAPDQIIQQCHNINGKNVECSPIGPHFSRFFPKCKGFDNKSYAELYQSYTIYELARNFYAENKISVLARNIYLSFFLTPTFTDPLKEYFNPLKQTYDIIHSFKNPELGDNIIKRIESELYISKHFLKDVCQCDPRKVYPRLLQIIEFYNVFNQLQLRNFYELQEEYANKNPDFLDGLRFFYDNIEEKQYETFPPLQYYQMSIKDFPVYNDFQNTVAFDFARSIKHKVQNDLNQIFTRL